MRLSSTKVPNSADEGITEYVQIKPILAGVTVVMKAAGTYREGDLSRDSGCACSSSLL